jgi:hypothetical protein
MSSDPKQVTIAVAQQLAANSLVDDLAKMSVMLNRSFRFGHQSRMRNVDHWLERRGLLGC